MDIFQQMMLALYRASSPDIKEAIDHWVHSEEITPLFIAFFENNLEQFEEFFSVELAQIA